MPPDDSGRTARDLLLNSWPGRLFIIAAALKVIVALVRLVGEVPAFLRVIEHGGDGRPGAFSVLFFLTRLVFLVQRRLLWRVRRKLILSYIFIGVVPSLLILGFFLLSTGFVAGTVGAYLFRDGYDDVTRQVQLLAEAAAVEIGRAPRTTEETVDRVRRNGSASLGYPTLSMVFIPASATGPPLVSRGPWEHLRRVVGIRPSWRLPWIRERPEGFTGTTSVALPDAPNEPELVIRAVRPAGRAAAPDRLGHRQSAARWRHAEPALRADGREGRRRDAEQDQRRRHGVGLRRRSRHRTRTTILALRQHGEPLRFVRLGDGRDAPRDGRALVQDGRAFPAAVGRAVDGGAGRFTLGDAFRVVFVVVAVLFLIIELVALVMGLALARSITSSIHELFMGTERVRQGDFTHRINISTKDQLGELAGSFNQMTGSIENLLQTAAEKKRLEEELRIARQIQMSLLPRGQLDMPGLGVTALCVPAREVGGDYYDFFPLGPGRLGVLIADVAGQGHVGGALHGGAEGADHGAQPDLSEPAPAPDRGQPHPVGQPRQPQLHHDDLRRHRPRQRGDDIRARGAHAAHLPARSGRRCCRAHRSSSQAGWSSACASTARWRSSTSCSRRSRSRCTPATSSSSTPTASPRR